MSKFNYVVAVRSIKMEKTTKHVAVFLATYADYETGECYPSIQTLMEDTGLSNRAICQHIKLLEKMGILVVDRANGRRSYYRFIAENISKAVTEGHTNNQELLRTISEQVINTKNESSESSEKQETKKSESKKPKSRMTQIPENFGISERVQKWADEKKFNRLDEHLENFVGYAKASAKKYADWDQAFMNAIRNNWAKLGNNQATSYQNQHHNRPQTAQEQIKQGYAEYWANRAKRYEQQNTEQGNVIDVTPKKPWIPKEVRHVS